MSQIPWCTNATLIFEDILSTRAYLVVSRWKTAWRPRPSRTCERPGNWPSVRCIASACPWSDAVSTPGSSGCEGGARTLSSYQYPTPKSGVSQRLVTSSVIILHRVAFYRCLASPPDFHRDALCRQCAIERCRPPRRFHDSVTDLCEALTGRLLSTSTRRAWALMSRSNGPTAKRRTIGHNDRTKGRLR
jgi:hypothetical protein